jgi:hypothetical protein
MFTFRAAILLAVSSLLIVIGVVSFPTGSGAKVQAPQQTTSTTKKARRQAFVPGEIIVRYRSESMAKSRTGAMRITARDGQLRSMRVDEFEGSTRCNPMFCTPSQTTFCGPTSRRTIHVSSVVSSQT